MKVLATMGAGSMRPILETTLPSFRVFAARHGYEIVVGEKRYTDRPFNWSKIVFLQSLLPTCEHILYVDADAVILDPSADPLAQIPSGAFQALVLQHGGFPNAGVWALSSTNEAMAFLDAVWEQESFIDHRWWEQAAMIHLLGFDTEPPHSRIATTEWARGTHWLPAEWNSLPLFEGLVPCRIRHYAGYPNAYRHRRLRLDMDSFRGTLASESGAVRRRPLPIRQLDALLDRTIGPLDSWRRDPPKARLRRLVLRRLPWTRPIYRALRRLTRR